MCKYFPSFSLLNDFMLGSACYAECVKMERVYFVYNSLVDFLANTKYFIKKGFNLLVEALKASELLSTSCPTRRSKNECKSFLEISTATLKELEIDR